MSPPSFLEEKEDTAQDVPSASVSDCSSLRLTVQLRSLSLNSLTAEGLSPSAVDPGGLRSGARPPPFRSIGRLLNSCSERTSSESGTDFLKNKTGISCRRGARTPGTRISRGIRGDFIQTEVAAATRWLRWRHLCRHSQSVGRSLSLGCKWREAAVQVALISIGFEGRVTQWSRTVQSFEGPSDAFPLKRCSRDVVQTKRPRQATLTICSARSSSAKPSNFAAQNPFSLVYVDFRDTSGQCRFSSSLPAPEYRIRCQKPVRIPWCAIII